MTAETVTAPAGTGSSWADAIRDKIDLVVTPIFFLILAASVGAMWVYGDLDTTSMRIVDPALTLQRTYQHIYMTFWSTLAVVAIAIPVGVFITRPAFKKFAPPILGVANAGQATPAFGLLVLFAGFFGTGIRTAIYALVVIALLPVLRNTMVGLQQVDQAVIEAGRGMGLSKRQALFRIELPLAVPIILAGIRTALVINVGSAALMALIGAGGLGEPIVSALQMSRPNALFVAGGLVALLALLIDFVAALSERYLRPKGI